MTVERLFKGRPDVDMSTHSCRYPDETRYPCCGYHCQTCTGNEVEDPYYCPNSPVRSQLHGGVRKNVCCISVVAHMHHQEFCLLCVATL